MITAEFLASALVQRPITPERVALLKAACVRQGVSYEAVLALLTPTERTLVESARG